VSDTRSQSAGSAPYTATPRRTGWTGWITFAAFMMMMLGFFQAIQGLAAIFNEDFYRVGANGLVVSVNYTVWGWVHLLLGVLIFLSGIGVLSGNVLGRAVGVVLAMFNAVLNMVFAPAQPGWALVFITVDVLVIWALIAHGREMEN
jgi:hypothetical protein